MEWQNQTVEGIRHLSVEMSTSKLSQEWDFVVSLYAVLIAGSSLSLNGLLLGVSFVKRTKLRTIESLLVSLAITDISLALTVFPLFISSSARHRWSFGDTGCNYFAFMSFALGVTSMMTLAEIAFVRYQMVCRYSTFSESKNYNFRTVSLLIFPYLHGGLWALGPFFGWGRYYYMPYGTSCSLFWHPDYISFLVCACVFCLILPVCVMVFCYTKIVRKKKQSEKSTISRTRSLKSVSSLTLKTLFMCIAFVLAWTPYALMGIVLILFPDTVFPMPVFVIPALFAKTSITTNPILHTIMSSTFRKDARSLCRCLKLKVCCRLLVFGETGRGCDKKPSNGVPLRNTRITFRTVSLDNSSGFSGKSTSF